MPPLPLRLVAVEAHEGLHVAAALFSYVLHSAAWAIGAVALVRCCARRTRTKHALWMFALVGPLFTTSLSALGAHSTATIGGQAHVDVRDHAAVASHAATRAQLSAERSPALWTVRVPPEIAVAAPLAAALTLFGLVRLGASLVLLRRALSARRAVSDARLCARFRMLAERIDRPCVRLTESSRAPGPLVMGRCEVCIPAGLLEGFPNSEVDAIFAHELAHVERRDGLWFPIIGAIEAVFWMQPLNRWLAARCRRTAELAADERAVQLTKSPLDLARALTRVAEAALPKPSVRVIPGMTGSRGLLLERVTRLVSAPEPPAPPDGKRHIRLAHWGAIAGLGMIGLATVNLCSLSAVAPYDMRAAAAAYRMNDASRHLAASRARVVYLEEMASLAQRAWEVGGALRAAHEGGATELGDPRLLQLEQDLRHIHATQAWTEQQYSAASEGGTRRAHADATRLDGD